MTRKIPMRKCVVTHSKYPKDELIRIVLTPEKNIEIDLTGKKMEEVLICYIQRKLF